MIVSWSAKGNQPSGRKLDGSPLNLVNPMFFESPVADDGAIKQIGVMGHSSTAADATATDSAGKGGFLHLEDDIAQYGDKLSELN